MPAGDAVRAAIQKAFPGYEVAVRGRRSQHYANDVWLFKTDRRTPVALIPAPSIHTLMLHDPRVLWPDTTSVAAHGYLYVTANQRFRQPKYPRRPGPYRRWVDG